MSESNQRADTMAENNSSVSKTSSHSKKKERRQKLKTQCVEENKNTVEDSSIVSEKVIDPKVEAGASTPNNVDLLSDVKLKSLLDEAYKYKSNPNILPLLRDAAKTPQEAMQKSFKFWSTQPVPKFDEIIEKNEAIEPNKKVAEIRAEPYALPEGFKWETLNLEDPLVLTELYTLLNENYVEDDDAMFRFDYQPEFLKWALQPPGWRQGTYILNISRMSLITTYIFHRLARGSSGRKVKLACWIHFGNSWPHSNLRQTRENCGNQFSLRP